MHQDQLADRGLLAQHRALVGGQRAALGQNLHRQADLPGVVERPGEFDRAGLLGIEAAGLGQGAGVAPHRAAMPRPRLVVGVAGGGQRIDQPLERLGDERRRGGTGSGGDTLGGEAVGVPHRGRFHLAQATDANLVAPHPLGVGGGPLRRGEQRVGSRPVVRVTDRAAAERERFDAVRAERLVIAQGLLQCAPRRAGHRRPRSPGGSG